LLLKKLDPVTLSLSNKSTTNTKNLSYTKSTLKVKHNFPLIALAYCEMFKTENQLRFSLCQPDRSYCTVTEGKVISA